MNYGQVTPLVFLGFCAALSASTHAGITQMSSAESVRASAAGVGGIAHIFEFESEGFVSFENSQSAYGSADPRFIGESHASMDLNYLQSDSNGIVVNGSATTSAMGLANTDGRLPHFQGRARVGFDFVTDEAIQVDISYTLLGGLNVAGDNNGTIFLSEYRPGDVTVSHLASANYTTAITPSQFSDSGSFSMLLGAGTYRFSILTSSAAENWFIDPEGEFNTSSAFDFSFSARTVPAPGCIGLMLVGFPAVSRRSRRSA